jgi:hypothetical protein
MYWKMINLLVEAWFAFSPHSGYANITETPLDIIMGRNVKFCSTRNITIIIMGLPNKYLRI